MKKTLLLAVALFMICISVSAQSKPTAKKATTELKKNAIGVRLGWGGEISYQRFLSSDRRIELTTGFGGYGFDLAASYQWLWPLDVDNIGFNWYAGAGAQLGAWDSSFGFGVLGQIGIEYNLKKTPIGFSIDWRPSIHVAPAVHFGWEGFAVGARYRF